MVIHPMGSLYTVQEKQTGKKVFYTSKSGLFANNVCGPRHEWSKGKKQQISGRGKCLNSFNACEKNLSSVSEI